MFKTNFQTVAKLYGQIFQSVENGAKSFPDDVASSCFATATITAKQVSKLVVHRNQQLISLYENVGKSFATAGDRLASL